MMLDELATYLEGKSVGVVKTDTNNPTWPIYKAGLSPGADDAIGLVEGPGDGPINEMSGTLGAVAAEAPSLVVHVRSASYATARLKAEAIWSVLHKCAGTLSGVKYYLVEARHSPFPIGRDDKSRWIIGCNYDVTKDRS